MTPTRLEGTRQGHNVVVKGSEAGTNLCFGAVQGTRIWSVIWAAGPCVSSAYYCMYYAVICIVASCVSDRQALGAVLAAPHRSTVAVSWFWSCGLQEG